MKALGVPESLCGSATDMLLEPPRVKPGEMDYGE